MFIYLYTMSMLRTYSPKDLMHDTFSLMQCLYQRSKIQMSKRCDASENFYFKTILDMHEVLRGDLNIKFTPDANDSVLTTISKSLVAIEKHLFGETDGLEQCTSVKDCIDKTKDIKRKLVEPISLCGLTS